MYTVTPNLDETAAEREERLILDNYMHNIVAKANLVLAPFNPGTPPHTMLFYSSSLCFDFINELHAFIAEILPKVKCTDYKGELEGTIVPAFFSAYAPSFSLLRDLANPPYNNAQAQCIMGECIQREWVEADEDESYSDYFKNAAAQGDRYSAWSLSLIYAQKALYIFENHPPPMDEFRHKKYQDCLLKSIEYARIAQDKRLTSELTARLNPPGSEPSTWPEELQLN